MRLLAAALFVYVGILLSGWLIGSWALNADWPPCIIVIPMIPVCAALLYAADRLFNRQRQEEAGLSSLSPSYDAVGEPIWVFRFVDGVKERLRAERAERRERSGMNAVCRGLFVFLACLWIVGALAAAAQGEVSWHNGLVIVLGLSVLYGFLYRPVLAHWHIWRHAPAEETVELRLQANGVRIVTDKVVAHKPWDEFCEVMQTSEGLVFYATDGDKLWLPASAIGTDSDVAAVMAFIEERFETEDEA